MRSLSQSARLQRRVEVIRLRTAGGTYGEIAEKLGLSRTGVFDICKRHDAAGAPALRDRARGRRLGQCRLIDPVQEAVIRRAITQQTPDQLGMPDPLWTREAVLRYVALRFSVRLSIRTLGTYLARWGLVPRKVLRAVAVAASLWTTRDYPAIAARARIEDGEILWAHEERLRPRGGGGSSGSACEPLALVIHDHSAWPSLTFAVNNRGRVRWKIYEEALTADRLIDFLRRLVKATARKVFLVVQGCPVERSGSVQSWLAEHVDDIEVFRRPAEPSFEASSATTTDARALDAD